MANDWQAEVAVNKATSAAKDAYGKVEGNMKDAAEKSGEAAKRGMSFASDAMNRWMEMIGELAQARSPQDVIRIHTAWFEKNMSACHAEVKRMTETMTARS